ncbi:MAG: heme exporter protein CcmD [Alphaproteobacteria bacterium]
MTEIFDMGGYGAYIWPAWGIAVVVLGALIVFSLRTMRARERELAELEATSPRRRRRDKSAGNPTTADPTTGNQTTGEVT